MRGSRSLRPGGMHLTLLCRRLDYVSLHLLRCFYLAWCYAPLKKYAEALSLTQHVSIHLRECRDTLAGTLDTDPINSTTPSFYPLSLSDLDKLAEDLAADSTGFKTDWFGLNGGDAAAHKKPLFFDIALNYINLDMERLQERAGKVPEPTVVAPATKTQFTPAAIPAVQEKKTKAEIERAATPEPAAQPTGGGLGSLLGGWWGRR